jgi:hypothetical protein
MRLVQVTAEKLYKEWINLEAVTHVIYKGGDGHPPQLELILFNSVAQVKNADEIAEIALILGIPISGS